MSTADRRLLTPRTLVGRHPATGVIHQLTIDNAGMISIERTPYVSTHPDGWTQAYEPITDEAKKHIWLILTIEQHPATWPEQLNE